MIVTFDFLGERESFDKLGLLIEYTPLSAHSLVSSHVCSPPLDHGGSFGNVEFSNESKYIAPSGINVGATVIESVGAAVGGTIFVGIALKDGAEEGSSDCDGRVLWEGAKDKTVGDDDVDGTSDADGGTDLVKLGASLGISVLGKKNTSSKNIAPR